MNSNSRDSTLSLYEKLCKHRAEPAEQKIKILREELLHNILTVETSSELLRQIAPEISDCLPADVSAEELQNTVNWLVEAARDLQEILDALTLDSEVPAPHTGD